MKRALCMLFLLGATVAMAIAGLAQDEKTQAARERADCPQGECCLWRLGLLASGKLEHKLGMPHPCPTGETSQGSGFLELKPLKSAGPPCDEMHMLIPDGSQLNAAIHTVRRKDDLAHVCGTFKISFQDKTIFEGEIELFHRINTHSAPFGPDPCDRRDHLQGWLQGKGTDTGAARDFLLCAMLVARTDPLNGGLDGYALGTTHLNGVIMRCRQ